MDLYFEFNHFRISIVELQQNGIRNTKELEEAILTRSFWDELSDPSGHLPYRATGFSASMNLIVVWFTIDKI